MFAKVFSQIFDSSIAEDYNCRRMFMDLLVLADSDGVVDMTLEAISRRTNVPIEEVKKYIDDLCQPDPKSRSKLHEGKRIIPVDSGRDWGWKIVNYHHYRKIRDEEVRRTYFRDAQRKYRSEKKKQPVKDVVLTELNKNGQVLTPASPSSSACTFLDKIKNDSTYSGVEIDRELEKAKKWCQKKNRRLTERFFKNWLEKADRVLFVPKPKSNYLPAGREPTEEEIANSKRIAQEQTSELREKLRMQA